MVLTGRDPRRLLIAAAAIGSGALLAGCGGSSSSSSSSGKAVSLSRAASLSSSAVGFKLTERLSETVAGTHLNFSGEGSFDNRSHEGSVSVNAQLGGQTYPLQVVVAHGTIYEHLPARLSSQLHGAKPWLSINLNQIGNRENISNFGSLMGSSSSTSDPAQYMNYLKASSKSVQNLGQATVDGVQTTHYRAIIDTSKLAQALPRSDRQTARQTIAALHRLKASYQPMDVWIDQSDLIRKLRVSFRETVKGKALAVVMTEIIKAYGAQPAPRIPRPNQTTNLLSLEHSGG